MVEVLEVEGIWMLVVGIMCENEVLIWLYWICGFEFLGYCKCLGKMSYGLMQGQWWDIVWMEWCSDVVGVDQEVVLIRIVVFWFDLYVLFGVWFCLC